MFDSYFPRHDVHGLHEKFSSRRFRTELKAVRLMFGLSEFKKRLIPTSLDIDVYVDVHEKFSSR